jgi:predicted transcriptional regulator
MPKTYDIERKLRKSRVKAKLVVGMTIAEIAEEEGFSVATILNDINAIGKDAILSRSEDVVEEAFDSFAHTVDWATEEAIRLHEDGAGRLDCLSFVVGKQKEKLVMAQSLGLLEKVAERTESEVNLNVKIPDEMIKKFGNYLAKNMTEE